MKPRRLRSQLLFLLLGMFGATAARAAVNVSVTPSRVDGVAPLFVHFDATATTADGIARPFHELGFEWNFDDAGAGTWTYSGRSKETATGAIAAHVFDDPGEYNVVLTVRTPDGETAAVTVIVEVEDPDLVYSGNDTVCVANGGGFAGCPSGALQVTSGDFDASLSSNMGTGKRILFRRGDTFACDATTYPDFPGPSTIGAFGSGDLPVINTTSFVLCLSDGGLVDDMRIMDLDMRDSGDNRMLWTENVVSNLLVYRVHADGFSNGAIQLGVTPYHNDIGVVECNLENTVGAVVFANGNRTGWLGNRMYNSGYHVCRLDTIQRTVVAHNHFEGAAHDKLELTMRCENTGVAECQFWVVSDNSFQGVLSDWTSEFGNGSAGHEDQTSNVIIERNYYVAGPVTQTHMNTFADDVTVRNNLMVGADTGIRLGRFGNEGPHVNDQAVNNTCYTDGNVDALCVTIDADVSQSLAANNLMAAPNAWRRRGAYDHNGTNTLETNYAVESAAFATEPPSAPYDFALTAASVDLIDTGSPYGLATGDYALNPRAANGDGSGGAECDIGAFEYPGLVPGIFSDGFESGGLDAWSEWTP
jgi:PKD repeat protein